MIKPANTVTPLPIATIRAAEARGFDAAVPMMQRAGTAAAEFLHQRLAPSSHIVVMVGPGNNGGDALVAAAELHKLGHRPTVVMPQAAPNASADAKQALMQWLVTGQSIAQALPSQKPDAVVDGLFGIGLSRMLQSPWAEVVQRINAWHVPLLALDIPSGIEADTGKLLGQPIQATWAITFIAPSLATAVPSSQAFFGECWVENLDLDANLDSDNDQ